MNVNPIEYIRSHMELVQRYNREEKITIAEYWKLIRWTRKNGKIAENIIEAEFEYWNQFETDIVIKGLKVHLENKAYEKLKESYTRGIIRNIALGANETVEKKKEASTNKNKFHNFEQKTQNYTAEELDAIARKNFEKKLEELGITKNMQV